MTGISRLVLLVFSIIFLTANSYPQDVRKLTLDESIKLGLENSHQLKTSRQQVISANARMSEVNSGRLPSLKFNALYTRLSPIDPFNISVPNLGTFPISTNIENNYTLRLTLQQPLFTGFRLSSSSSLAEYNYLAEEEEYNKDEEELLLNIKTAYWNVFKANKYKEVIDENVEQIKAHITDVQNLFNEGMATRNDVLKVQVQLAEAELRQIDAKNLVRLSKVNLSNSIGIPLSTGIEIQDDIKPSVEEVKELDVLIESAHSNRSELKSIDYRIKAGESGVTAARSSWYPQIFLSGNYNYAKPNLRIFPQQDKFEDTWDVSLSLQWDIWNWGTTSSQTDQAQALVEQTRETYLNVKDAVELEVTQNYLNLTQAKEKIFVAENSVSQAEENYRVSNEKFRNGLLLSSELLDAEVLLLQANTNYIQSLVDYEVAKARLEKSTGRIK